MRRNNIDDDLSALAFEFFYWFSRFEFLLKRNGFLKCTSSGAKAEPSWRNFVEKYKGQFSHTEASNQIVELNPSRQIIDDHGSLSWRQVGLEDCNSELCKVVRLLCTVRNNLFHGGKSGVEGWDDPARMKELLNAGITVLGSLAELSGYESDYSRYY